MTTTSDPYAGSRETTEGRVYTVTGGDWDSTLGADPHENERLVVNMGPQHPSTPRGLRLGLDLEGETGAKGRGGIRYPHTRIRKKHPDPQLAHGATLLTP